VPGVEWDTGNLGQGLSVGVGKALYARITGQQFRTYVIMGDGEQQKGQIAEARRTAVKLGLTSLIALIDFNGLQISGKITDIMPQQIAENWKSDGWNVIDVDGHDLDALYKALYAAQSATKPTMILARTIMGKGVSFMENDESYHGAAIKKEQLSGALAELGAAPVDLDALLVKRKQGPPPSYKMVHSPYPKLEQGSPIVYSTTEKTDNRSAFGKALVSVTDANQSGAGKMITVFDCDLAKSVKTDGFAKKYPNQFIQCGISEHSTAATAGALSSESTIAVWADFGVFGVDETYNQARLNDINHSNLKLICTHSGVNVGEDGKTHQCIDYFALLNSTFGWQVITPADPNQTDRIVRHVLCTPGNFAVIMGRSVISTILKEDGSLYFGEDYLYRYGRMEWIRKGEEVALVAAGNMLPTAMSAWTQLASEGLRLSLVSVSDWSSFHADDLKQLARSKQIITLEDHNVKTGLGTSLASALNEHRLSVPITKMGVTKYASSGVPDDLYRMLGIDASAVAKMVASKYSEAKVMA
jgi:transketolase